MYRIQKIIALVTSLIIIGIAFLVFSFNLANVSVENDYIEIKTDKIVNPVVINTNFFGIPFIRAQNESDLFFAIGYYQASMRMWQMEYYRRLTGGRLSEVLGDETLKIDKFMRCFEIEQIAKNNYKNLSAKSRTVLEYYSEGVNSYIKNNSSSLSFEFDALNYKPDNWEPYHSLMIGKFLTFELSLSIWADITFGEIAEKLGVDKTKHFLPDEFYTSNVYSIPETIEKNKTKNYSSFIDETEKIRDMVGIRGTSSGSNCWTINRPGDSLTTIPILANDAHLLLAMPARWMQMRIQSPEIEAFGMTIPGIPLVLSGRNKNISWGLTNIMVDGFDYFIEQLDNKQENYLNYDSTYKKIIYKVDTIKIAGKLPHVYYQRRTDKSIIISDFHILDDSELFLNFKIKTNQNSLFKKYALSFRWIGNVLNDEVLALYNVNTSNNFQDFKYALRTWSTPGLNFHYLDKSGNMGVVSSSAIPVRGSLCNPNFPNNGWKSESQWKNITRLPDSIFSVLNPPNAYTSSANNKLIQKYEHFISNYWEPDARINRINELLNESNLYNYRDAQYMQNDFLSVYSRDVHKITFKILENYKNLLTDDEVEILSKLKGWDFIFSRGSVNSSFFTFYFQKLIFNIFFDELGERLYRQYSFISSIPTRKLLELLNKDDDEVFDIQGTKNIENRDFIVFKSFRDAVLEFNRYFENIPYDNRGYGKLHKLLLEHPFSRSEFLKYAVNVGPFETGGNNTTLNNGEWNLNNPYKQVVGASMRIINDLKSDMIYSSIPGGISGDPMHPNYTDQLQIWLNGGYVKSNFYLNKNETKPFLKLIPHK